MWIRRIRSKLIKRATLAGVIAVVSALGSCAAITPAWAAGSARLAASQTIPVPPVGWHPPRITRPWMDPRAKTWKERLSPAACSALNHQHPGAAPSCQVRNYVTGEKGLPLPRGTRFVTANSASAPYHQFDYTFTQCGISCSVWKDDFEINGVYNGSHVYQWNIWNTFTTNGPSGRTTWKGYRDNGGAYLSWCGCNGMQFGVDAEITASIAGTQETFDTWQRVWVDIWGTWFDYTSGT